MPKLAIGTRGFILLDDEQVIFRVYNDQGFKDYRLTHYDLEVEVIDESAAFIEGDEPRLCYDPAFLFGDDAADA